MATIRQTRPGLALMVLVLMAGAAHALSPADKCEASKLSTAGKYDFCRMQAAAKAVKVGGMSDFSKCDAKLSQKWAAVESKGHGMCPSNSDEAVIQMFIAQYAGSVAAELAGGTLTATACGNGVVDPGEDCDFGTLNGQTCATKGFAGGILACAAGCVFDTSGCWNARFVDNADGTITDHQTGLQWEKKVGLNGAQDYANLHDADSLYQWAGSCSGNPQKDCQPTLAASALCAANVEGGTTGCDVCGPGEGTCTITYGSLTNTIWTWAFALNTANFAGHSDWRVPTRRELEGIVDYADSTPPATDVAFAGANCGTTCTDITDPSCSCTASFYWSASALAVSGRTYWFLDFTGGSVSGYFSDIDNYVRAVRTGP